MHQYDTGRLTPRMARCLQRADEFADSFGHDYTGVEHVVLSVLSDPEAAPTAIAEKNGILGYLIYEIQKYIQTGTLDSVEARLVPEGAQSPDQH